MTDRIQNEYLAANCKMRGSAELWIKPNAEDFRLFTGLLKFSVVQNVEKLEAQLHLLPFGNSDNPLQIRVQVEKARTHE